MRFRRPGETSRVERHRNRPLPHTSPVSGRGTPAPFGRETPGSWKGEESMVSPQRCRSKLVCSAAQAISRRGLSGPHPQPTLSVRRRDARISLTKIRQNGRRPPPGWDFRTQLSILCILSIRSTSVVPYKAKAWIAWSTLAIWMERVKLPVQNERPIAWEQNFGAENSAV
jgi:hypothetical protein